MCLVFTKTAIEKLRFKKSPLHGLSCALSKSSSTGNALCGGLKYANEYGKSSGEKPKSSKGTSGEGKGRSLQGTESCAKESGSVSSSCKEKERMGGWEAVISSTVEVPRLMISSM